MGPHFLPTNTPTRPPTATSQSPLGKGSTLIFVLIAVRPSFVFQRLVGFPTKTPDLFFLVWISGFWFFPWEIPLFLRGCIYNHESPLMNTPHIFGGLKIFVQIVHVFFFGGRLGFLALYPHNTHRAFTPPTPFLLSKSSLTHGWLVVERINKLGPWTSDIRSRCGSPLMTGQRTPP